MEEEPRRPTVPPDSLTGKLDAIFDADAGDEGEGDAEEVLGEEPPPKRPTDPPF